LVSWKQVIQCQERGGLGIRSPKLRNLAFRGKIVWRLIDEQQAWWKRFPEAKYLSSPSQQLLDSEMPTRSSTRVWKLCKKVIPFMAQNISKVPIGGNKINIGANKIMENQPINN